MHHYDSFIYNESDDHRYWMTNLPESEFKSRISQLYNSFYVNTLPINDQFLFIFQLLSELPFQSLLLKLRSNVFPSMKIWLIPPREIEYGGHSPVFHLFSLLFSRAHHLGTSWTTAHQAPPSSTVFQSLLKFMSIYISFEHVTW